LNNGATIIVGIPFNVNKMKKILIIDDDSLIRSSVKKQMEESGYTVFTAENGNEGIQLAFEIIPDLIISEIAVLKFDGIKLLNQIREKYSFNNIPFIFLTTKSNLKDMQNAISNGIDDYITKPFKINELKRIVENKLNIKSIVDKKLKRINKKKLHNIPSELKSPLLSVIGFTDSISDEFKNFPKQDIIKILNSLSLSSKKLNKAIKKYMLHSEVELLLLNKNNETLKPNTPTNSSINNDTINKNINCKKKLNHVLLRNY